MSIKSILFNTDMVKAILDGRKTVTRRAVKNYGYVLDSPYRKEHPEVDDVQVLNKLCRKPYEVGDILWVRETWSEGYREGTYIYKADDKLAGIPTFKESTKLIYHPSIHMPKEAARIFLKVTDVRVERLHDMTEIDTAKEGIVTDIQTCRFDDQNFKENFGGLNLFEKLWDSTVKKSDFDIYRWDANPFVWVIEFERCEKLK